MMKTSSGQFFHIRPTSPNRLARLTFSNSTSTSPRLPIFFDLKKKAQAEFGTKFPLEEAAVLCRLHALKNDLTLQTLIDTFGVKVENIYVMDKPYSRCPEVIDTILSLGVNYMPSSDQINLGGFSTSVLRDANWMWKTVVDNVVNEITGKKIKKILIVDHGFAIAPFIPLDLIRKNQVIGIEKTASGIAKLTERGMLPYPIISVAGSAAKKHGEPSFIADAVLERLGKQFIEEMKKSNQCAVIGYGPIGQAMTNELLLLQIHVTVYDRDRNKLPERQESKLDTSTDLKAVITNFDYVFGCTGEDITKGTTECFRLSSRNQIFISCSSEDEEFATALRQLSPIIDLKHQNLDPLKDWVYRSERGGTLTILDGGFPKNFSNSGKSVPDERIDPTRALVLGGIIQAAKFFQNSNVMNKPNGFYILEPEIQAYVMRKFIEYNPDLYKKELIEKLQDVHWLKNESLRLSAELKGSYEPCYFALEEDNKLGTAPHM